MTYYTIKEISVQLKISDRTIGRLIYSGKLAATKVGRQWRISQFDLDRYIKKQTTKTQ